MKTADVAASSPRCLDESGKLICYDQEIPLADNLPQNYRTAGDVLINETNAGALSAGRFISASVIRVPRKIRLQINQIAFFTSHSSPDHATASRITFAFFILRVEQLKRRGSIAGNR